jgi:hypothetical protein
LSPDAFRILTLFRLLAFMVLVYLALGWLVERYSKKPDSKLKAFFRVICSPITGFVSRFLPPDAEPRRVLAISIGVVGVLWILLIALSEIPATG